MVRKNERKNEKRIFLYFFILLVIASGGEIRGFNSLSDEQLTPDVHSPTALPSILYPSNASLQEFLAAKEIRRYTYLRTGKFLPLLESDGELPPGKDLIVVGQKTRTIIDYLAKADSNLRSVVTTLGNEQFKIKSFNYKNRKVVIITGGESIGTLYGAYRFIEHLGVRFFLHGDVIPDRQIAVKLPDVDVTGKPLFVLRGVNSWGTQPFGIDQWNADDYKSVFTQLVKMRMNFMGMHCYPEGHPYAEPTVWVGQKGDFDEKGEVSFSYPACYYNTFLKTYWGPYYPKKTGDYSFGGSILFERDDWGPDVMADFAPRTSDPAQCNELFNRTGRQFEEAFEYAKQLGIKTCVGTEAPLSIPKLVQQRLRQQGKDPDSEEVVREVYEGIFERIMRTYPLDYYWIWTTEFWLNGNNREEAKKVVDEILLARQALRNVKAPFGLATAGWVLGPADDRTLFDKLLPKEIAISAISGTVGHDPVDSGFGEINDRNKWAIPWLEDDGALASPQLWVGRTRKDAADALAYGCTGLMGLHWRTRIIGPNISALAQAGWEQKPWNPEPGNLPDAKILKIPTSLASADPKYGANVVSATTPIAWAKPRGALASKDFYDDWAVALFGEEAGPEAGRIFQRIDGAVPRAAGHPCPCGIIADNRPWKIVAREYTFIDDLAGIRSKVKGAGNIERFDYWLNTFQYLRSLARIECDLAVFDQTIKSVNEKKNTGQRQKLAAQKALEAYKNLLDSYGQAYHYMLASVCTNAGLASIVNLEQESAFWPHVIERPAKQLAEALGAELPAEVIPPKEYQGMPRIIVPTVRTILIAGESLNLKVIVLDSKRPKQARLAWRKMGNQAAFRQISLNHLVRGVYTVTLPDVRNDLEYYVEVTMAGNDKILRFPATAPTLNQSVVVIPEKMK